MENSLTDDEVSQRYEELIRLILAPTELPADEFVSAFQQEIPATRENYPTASYRECCQIIFSLSFNHRFDEAGRSGSFSVSLFIDWKSAFDFEARGNGMAEVRQLHPGFEWDWETATENMIAGGIEAIASGMIAFDDWLKPQGFRFIAFDDGRDSYHGFPIRSDDHQRALDIALELGIDAFEPISAMDRGTAVSRLDADKVRAAKFPRAFRGLDPALVKSDLEAIATGIDNHFPDMFMLIVPGRLEISQATLRLGGIDKAAYEAFLVDLLSQMQG